MAAVFVLTGCGTSASTTAITTATPATVTVGAQTYALDQLAPAPDDGSNAHLVYAVIRVFTTAPGYTAHAAVFTLVDAAGRHYTPVTPTAYVPIDALDGLVVSPAHPGDGVVAFPTPSARPVSILVADGAGTGVLHAP